MSNILFRAHPEMFLSPPLIEIGSGWLSIAQSAVEALTAMGCFTSTSASVRETTTAISSIASSRSCPRRGYCQHGGVTPTASLDGSWTLLTAAGLYAGDVRVSGVCGCSVMRSDVHDEASESVLWNFGQRNSRTRDARVMVEFLN